MELKKEDAAEVEAIAERLALTADRLENTAVALVMTTYAARLRNLLIEDAEVAAAA